MQRALDEAKKEVETDKETSKRARLEWETERQAMKEEISELRGNLRQSCEMLKRLEEKHTVRRAWTLNHICFYPQTKTH